MKLSLGIFLAGFVANFCLIEGSVKPILTRESHRQSRPFELFKLAAEVYPEEVLETK